MDKQKLLGHLHHDLLKAKEYHEGYKTIPSATRLVQFWDGYAAALKDTIEHIEEMEW